MAFLSNLIGRHVTDVEGKRIGKLQDVVARIWTEFPHPIVEALVVRGKSAPLMIPLSAVAVLIAEAIPLRYRLEELESFVPREGDIFLVRDILDKQIIDKEGARVVRVNDLELVTVNGTTLVSNVDVGALGVFRRVGMAHAAQRVLGWFRHKAPPSSISWDDVELLQRDHTMRLKVPMKDIAQLHPADVADILGDLGRLERSDFLGAMDVPHMADALEEVEPDFQARLLENLPNDKVADVLEEMEPDEAADLLAEMPKDRSTDLLELMEKEDAEDVRRLLSYPEDSAGGIMTTEFAATRPDLTAAQVTRFLRENADKAETIFYVYVTDDGNHLLGVFSLKNLILADPETPVSAFMTTRVITVRPMDYQDEVARVISKYDLLAVPVVDEENRIHGIVTADDALDKIIPTAWKKRLPRLYH